ncbi:MAG: hypothetical protein AAFZ65_15575 [Planctomycetota bacterium]
MLRTLIAPLVLFVPALVPSAQPTPAVDSFQLHPMPSEPVAIPATGMNLWGLLEGLEADTGTHFVVDKGIRDYLEDEELLLARPMEVPAAARWSAAETFLAEAGGFFEELRASGPRMIAIRMVDDSNSRSHSSLVRRPRFVPSEHLDAVAEYPASMVETNLFLEHTDVRNLSNSLRSLLANTDHLVMVPGGNSSSLVLRGTGARVAELAQMLRAIDVLEAEAAAQRASQEQAAEDGGGHQCTCCE